jgi:hypothetical protein
MEVEPGCQSWTLFNLAMRIIYERGFLELRSWEQALWVRQLPMRLCSPKRQQKLY